MGSRYVTLDRTWLPNGSTHDSTAFLRRNSLTIIGFITTDLAASAKCAAVTGMAVSAYRQKPEERGIVPCCSFC
jgi:hypothetical protein